MTEVFLFADPRNNNQCRPLSMLLFEVKYLMSRHNAVINTAVTPLEIERHIDLKTRLIGFSGHCAKNEILVVNENGYVTESRILRIMEAKCSIDVLECVYFSCCNSVNLAHQISERFLKTFVVCWDGPVADDIAYLFLVNFYDNLRPTTYFAKDYFKYVHAFQAACQLTNFNDQWGRRNLPCLVRQNVVMRDTGPALHLPEHSWMTAAHKQRAADQWETGYALLSQKEFQTRKAEMARECNNPIRCGECNAEQQKKYYDSCMDDFIVESYFQFSNATKPAFADDVD